MSIESVARRKLRQLQVARRLDDLRVPPGNCLEALKGDREGQFSIRTSDQYRVCFRWTAAGVLRGDFVTPLGNPVSGDVRVLTGAPVIYHGGAHRAGGDAGARAPGGFRAGRGG